MKPGGRLLLSSFGPRTLHELREAFAAADTVEPHRGPPRDFLAADPLGIFRDIPTRALKQKRSVYFPCSLALCAERRIAVQTIKSVARRRWPEGTQPTHDTWYQPLKLSDFRAFVCTRGGSRSASSYGLERVFDSPSNIRMPNARASFLQGSHRFRCAGIRDVSKGLRGDLANGARGRLIEKEIAQSGHGLLSFRAQRVHGKLAVSLPSDVKKLRDTLRRVTRACRPLVARSSRVGSKGHEHDRGDHQERESHHARSLRAQDRSDAQRRTDREHQGGNDQRYGAYRRFEPVHVASEVIREQEIVQSVEAGQHRQGDARVDGNHNARR